MFLLETLSLLLLAKDGVVMSLTCVEHFSQLCANRIGHLVSKRVSYEDLSGDISIPTAHGGLLHLALELHKLIQLVSLVRHIKSVLLVALPLVDSGLVRVHYGASLVFLSDKHLRNSYAYLGQVRSLYHVFLLIQYLLLCSLDVISCNIVCNFLLQAEHLLRLPL